MGRKKKRKKDEGEGFLNAFKQETLEGIVAIFFIIISLFLLLSPFGKAGIVGNATHEFLELIFGPIGYYLLPVILIVLGVSFFKTLSNNLAWPKIIGGTLMLVTGLGILDILIEQGGLIGQYINMPLLALFGVWMTAIGHIGIFIIAILVIFDLSLKFSHIQNFMSKYFSRDKKQVEEEVEPEIKQPEEDEDESEEEQGDDDEEVEVVRKEEQKEEAPKKTSGLIFFSRKNENFQEYSAPPLSLLSKDSGKPGVGDIKANTNIIKRTLANFGIRVEMDEVSVGPSVTRYALKPAEGVKLSKIVSLQNDLALALAAHPLRIEAPIPGKSLVGIEIPNSSKTTVGLASIFKNDEFQKSDKPLLLGLGRGISGDTHFTNLAKAPHMLIAGATGAGKSVTIHAIITSLLYRNSPEMLKFIMIDPKRVELTMYNKIPHLLTPVITDPKKTILALKWAGKEMSRRYDILEEHGVRDITSYHENILKPATEAKGIDPDKMPEKMPYIVVIIDELADIMQTYPRELESGIVRLAQMSRAVGIHLIISTQRPSVNVITGLIKANVPSRIALQVASQIDSRTILDMPGAEKLLGAGDMLFLSGDISQPRRIQSAFISEDEVKSVVKFLSRNYESELDDTIDLDNKENESNSESLFNAIDADDGEDEDDLYGEAKEVVIAAGKASTSYLQRKLKIGYSRAARIMDILEEKGVIGPADGSKPREVLVGEDSAGNSNSSDSYGENSDDSDDENEQA